MSENKKKNDSVKEETKKPVQTAEGRTGEFIDASSKGEEASKEASSTPAKEVDVDKLLRKVMKQNEKLQSELNAEINKKNTSETDEKMGKMLDLMLEERKSSKKPKDVKDSNNTAMTSDSYKNVVENVDGRSLVHNQSALRGFKSEKTVAISIPRGMKDYIGPNLDVTVNGVRVSIPCDGKTYQINKTHYLHMRERLAKLDLQNTKASKDVEIIS